jgi:hypothetical protein
VSGYGRLRRGPMAADRFTQISNSFIRDPRISGKAKSAFMVIASHRDGYGITPESIALYLKEGVSAIKAGLRELEEYGYLVRTQRRRKDGTLAPVEYYITDAPVEDHPRSQPVDGFHPPAPTCGDAPDVDERGGAQNRRSGPVDENPLAVDPLAADPPAEKVLHKKTNSKNTSLKKTLSPAAPPAPATPADPPPGDGERETAAAPDKPADPAAAVAAAWSAARGGYPNPMSEARVRTHAAGLLAAGWPLEAVTALAEDMARTQPSWTDLARHADHWTPPGGEAPAPAPAGPSSPSIPPWCGKCGEGNPAAELNPRFRFFEDPATGAITKCPDCHPAALAAA